MSIYIERIAPCIYYIRYEGNVLLTDLKDGQTRLHDLIGAHSELQDKYIVIYERREVNYQIRVNFAQVKLMLQQTPTVRSDDSIFLAFSKPLQAITSWLHLLMGNTGDLHFVNSLDEGIDLAYVLLASQNIIGDISCTPSY